MFCFNYRLFRQSRKPAPMKLMLRLLMTGLLLGVLVFCVFGFMATYETMRTVVRWTWRVIYAVAGLSTLAGIAAAWRGRQQTQH